MKRIIRSDKHPGIRFAGSKQQPGIKLIRVSPELAGRLAPGDRILAVDGTPIEDVLDFHYHSVFGMEPELRVLGEDGKERLQKIRSEELEGDSLEFEPLQFKTCGNDCVFCFIHQMPDGLREDLYLMDEDYRLGFLYGNYVTLALAREHELDRIIRQHLSPVYLSVHATDMELRNRLLGLKRSRDVHATIRRLLDGGIDIHTQIVLLPGWNDGEALERTLTDLVAYQPGILSLGIVPVGLTRHRERLDTLDGFDAAGCAKVIDQVRPWQERCLAEFGSRFVHLGDEFYLQADRPLPPTEAYEDFFLIDNGIGMAREFLDVVRAEAREWREPVRNCRVGILTGGLGEKLFREQLLPELASLPGLELHVAGLANSLFGEKITVSGLLPGRELLEGRTQLPAELDLLLLPPNTLNAADRFLDDLTLEEFRASCDLPVMVPESGLLGAVGEFTRSLKGEST
jgi:putative radical SAM enzyme (TIGR03279 family)